MSCPGRGGKGSNQYQKVSGSAATEQTARRDLEAVAWAFHPDPEQMQEDRHRELVDAVLNGLSDHTFRVQWVLPQELERGADDDCYRLVTFGLTVPSESRDVFGTDELVVEMELFTEASMFQVSRSGPSSIARGVDVGAAATVLSSIDPEWPDVSVVEDTSMAGWSSPDDWQVTVPFEDRAAHITQTAVWTVFAPRTVWEQWRQRLHTGWADPGSSPSTDADWLQGRHLDDLVDRFSVEPSDGST